MHPAFSVIFLTTLAGAAQGLFLALYTAQTYSSIGAFAKQDSVSFYGVGSLIALVLLGAGLFASFFHLGRPERAWRAATQWRTSWLSREVIALPIFGFFLFLYGAMHYFGLNPNLFGDTAPVEGELTYLVGGLATVFCFVLFICTGMIYASLKFLQEWHTPLTVINYTLLGTTSGFVLATVLAAYSAPDLVAFFAGWSIVLLVVSFISRVASLVRNNRIKYVSTVQTAIGVKHSRIEQKAQGAMGGSFNTREFFHGKTAAFFKSIKWIFLALVFVVPLPMLISGISMGADAAQLLLIAFLVQYVGLIAERWFFFAQAKHPQNLYYQTI